MGQAGGTRRGGEENLEDQQGPVPPREGGPNNDQGPGEDASGGDGLEDRIAGGDGRKRKDDPEDAA